jgi:homoserine kinase
MGAVAAIASLPDDDLIHVGFLAACEAAGRRPPARVDYAVASTIPVARGLGSSAAALLAGTMLANEALGLGFGRADFAALCSRAEGHPDNVGAAVFGGAVLSVTGSDEQRAQRYAFSALRVHPDLAFVFVVPGFEITTSSARAVLPAALPYKTAVTAVAKGAALVQGLATGESALLAHALDDVVHVPYRRQLIPGYLAVVQAAREAGAFGATLSGSGSTMAAVVPRSAADRVGKAMQEAWSEVGIAAEVIVGDGTVGAAEGRG